MVVVMVMQRYQKVMVMVIVMVYLYCVLLSKERYWSSYNKGLNIT